MTSEGQGRGPIAWMAGNPVAANIFLVILIVGGFISTLTIKQEVFPEFSLDMISVSVIYPGANPEEIEQGILFAVEEAVRGIDGVKRVISVAREGIGSVTVELLLGADGDNVLNDIKSAVDQIQSFPLNAERPTVRLLAIRSEVLTAVIYGDTSEHVLRNIAEQVRDDLLLSKDITLVELGGIRPREISVEISQATLKSYGFTLTDVASRIASSSIETPAGDIKTTSGELALRTSDRLDKAIEFEDVIVASNQAGVNVRLGDIATVTDTFAETSERARYNGKNAVLVKVFRTGDQTPIEISDTVHAYVKDFAEKLPAGISIDTWNDMSEYYRGRMSLLLRNACIGLVLVFFVLGLFLEARLAFWVTMGIPASFFGSFLLLPSLDISINMLSLFAFIVTLGMVVDDAIVVGENIYDYRKQGLSHIDAAVVGAKQISVPIFFAIFTSITAFLPMYFVPGIMGKFFRVIPAIVVAVLVISLFESIFILPSHLAHTKGTHATRGFRFAAHQKQQEFMRRFSEGLSGYTYLLDMD